MRCPYCESTAVRASRRSSRWFPFPLSLLFSYLRCNCCGLRFVGRGTFFGGPNSN